MDKITLPSSVRIESGKAPHQATVVIEPCFPGYGTTLGNALRRVLLSSMPGAAITAFKLKGALHEFTTIPHVKEDVVEICLNLKNVRLRVFSAEPVRLHLKAKGERAVTAGDIAKSSDVEVVNPEHVIATITDSAGEIDLELMVSQGRGYVPTEAREREELEVGMIALDAIYTPVRNVGFQVESVRVGQMTNWDKLVMQIETDGSLLPAEALREATQVLLEQFGFIHEQISGGASALVESGEPAASVDETAAPVEPTDEPAKDKEPKKRTRKKKEATE